MSLMAYMAQLSPMEQKVLQIASSHLETSFSLVKSIGFQEWQAQSQVQAERVPAPAQQAQQAQQAPTPAQAPKMKIKIKKKLTPTLA